MGTHEKKWLGQTPCVDNVVLALHCKAVDTQKMQQIDVANVELQNGGYCSYCSAHLLCGPENKDILNATTSSCMLQHGIAMQ